MATKPQTSMTDEPTAAYHKGSGETYTKTPFSPPGPNPGRELTEEVPDGWHQLTNVEGFLKWQYKDTPYRVIAYFYEERGHWRAIFTTTYTGTHLIRGNCGGGESGMLKATLAAKEFMRENDNGCPPPEEYE